MRKVLSRDFWQHDKSSVCLSSQFSLLSPGFTATVHEEKMGALEGREDGSPLPFQRVPWEQGKGASGWWLSLRCHEPHHPLCVKAKPSMGMRSLCHEVPVSESYWALFHSWDLH